MMLEWSRIHHVLVVDKTLQLLLFVSGPVWWEVASAETLGEAPSAFLFPWRSSQPQSVPGSSGSHLHQWEDTAVEAAWIRRHRAREYEELSMELHSSTTGFWKTGCFSLPFLQVDVQKLRLYCDPLQSDRETACEIPSVVSSLICPHQPHLSVTACKDDNTCFISSWSLSLRRMMKGYVDYLISQKDHSKFSPVSLPFAGVEPFFFFSSSCDGFVCISSVSIHSCGHSRRWLWLCGGTAGAARPSWTHGSSHKCWFIPSLNIKTSLNWFVATTLTGFSWDRTCSFNF